MGTLTDEPPPAQIHDAAGIGRWMIHDAAGIVRLMIHDAAMIVRIADHDAAVIVRLMIHDAMGGPRPHPCSCPAWAVYGVLPPT